MTSPLAPLRKQRGELEREIVWFLPLSACGEGAGGRGSLHIPDILWFADVLSPFARTWKEPIQPRSAM